MSDLVPVLAGKSHIGQYPERSLIFDITNTVPFTPQLDTSIGTGLQSQTKTKKTEKGDFIKMVYMISNFTLVHGKTG
jgi:hypothetical protein